MTNQPKPITILGGMGPQASSRLYDLLISHSSEHPRHIDGVFPHIILRSLAVEDFISGASNQAAGREILIKAARASAQDNSRIVAIACNTAHIFADDVSANCQAPFVSMIGLVTHAAKNSSIKTVGLLASPTTIKTSLYADALLLEGVNIIQPSESEILLLEKIIRSVLAGRAAKREVDALQKIATNLLQNGAEGLILGCTELPLIFPKDLFDCPVFDSLEIMSRELIDKYYE